MSVSPSTLIAVDRDQHDERRAHAPQHEEDRRGWRDRPRQRPRAGFLLAGQRLLQEASSGFDMPARDQRRWNETVSITSSTTETTLANSAPPDSETIAAIISRREPLAGDVHRVPPHDRRSDELQVRDQAGGEVHGADLGTVTELQHGRDQVDDDRGEELVDVVQCRIGDVTDEEAEVERGGQQDEEAEDHLLEAHRVPQCHDPWRLPPF